MNLKAFISSIFILGLTGPALSGEISIPYPWEGLEMPFVEKTFIMGSVEPATGTLRVNGEEVKVYETGSFLAYLPVSAGDFAFGCELFDGYATSYYSRKIRVAKPPLEISTSALSLEIVSPSRDEILNTGDLLKIFAAGTPNKKAEFSVKRLADDYPMTEMPKGSGRYYASYYIEEGKNPKRRNIEVRLFGGESGGDIEAESEAEITVENRPWLVVTSTDNTVLRNAVSGGYMMFLPEGVKLVANARKGPMVRIRLSGSLEGWVHESQIERLGKGEIWPEAETGTIRVSETDKGAEARIYLGQKVPFMFSEEKRKLTLFLYYADAHTNWVVYDNPGAFVENVSFFSPEMSVARVNFELSRDIWGYGARYENGYFVVEIKKKPEVSGKWPKPLSGLTAVLDPGHSMTVGGVPMKENPPYDGAISPAGWTECEANLAIAETMKSDFENLGAAVRMTRTGDEEVPLKERPRMAREFGGDIFISVHNNALPDGVDPFAGKRGFSVYYYHGHSADLARAVHSSLAKTISLPDEGVRFGDYHVVRMTDMPAILLENAYMIYPEHEKMLRDESFRAALSKATAEGVLELFGVSRRKKGGRR